MKLFPKGLLGWLGFIWLIPFKNLRVCVCTCACVRAQESEEEEEEDGIDDKLFLIFKYLRSISNYNKLFKLVL